MEEEEAAAASGGSVGQPAAAVVAAAAGLDPAVASPCYVSWSLFALSSGFG